MVAMACSPGDRRPEHDDLRRRGRARGGGERGNVLAQGVRPDNGALVAGYGAHRGERVHALGPRGAGDELVGEDRNPGVGELLDEFRLLRPVYKAREDRTLP